MANNSLNTPTPDEVARRAAWSDEYIARDGCSYFLIAISIQAREVQVKTIS